MKDTLRRIRSTDRTTLFLAARICIVVLAATAVFSQELAIVFTDSLNSESASHILAIPFLLVYILYRKRKMIKASIYLDSGTLFNMPINELAGSVLFFSSFLIYWYGSYTFTPLEIHMVALPVFTSACILMLFNTQIMRQLLFPTALLFLLIPPPAEILFNLGTMLSTLSSEIAHRLLVFSRIPATLILENGSPEITLVQADGVSTVTFFVDIACSGIYSLIGFLVFALFTVYIVRDKIWKRIILFVSGFPLIYFLNVLRIFMLGVIGFYYSEDLAINVFHLVGGWVLIFVGTLFLLVTSEKIFHIQIWTKQTGKCPECRSKPLKTGRFCMTCGRMGDEFVNRITKIDLLKGTTIVIAVVLILSAQAPVLALTQGPPEIILQTVRGEQVSTEILPQIHEYVLEFEGRDEEFEEVADQDASLAYVYYPENYTEEAIYATIEIASTRSSLHRWEACLIKYPLRYGYLPQVDQIALYDVELLDNPPIIGRYFIFQNRKSNLTQIILYWFETSVFQVNSTSQTKQVKISLMVYPNSEEDIPRLEDQLLRTAVEIASYWEPIKKWAPISLLISRNGDKLIGATTAVLLGIIMIYAYEKRKEKRRSDLACKKLPREYQQLVTAVHKTGKETLPTLRNVMKVLENISGKRVDKETLLQRLDEVERLELVRKDVGNRLDEPVIVWMAR